MEFIKHIADEELAVQYLKEKYPDIDYYDAEIYLKGAVNVESELVIFDSEKIEGMIEMEVGDEKYYNLFSLDFLVEIHGDYSKSISTDREVAEKIISYRINDA